MTVADADAAARPPAEEVGDEADRGVAGADAIADVSDEPSADWDALAVDPPGGDVHQGTAWAEHRRSQGWRPRFVRFAGGRVALVLTHSKRPLPGIVAYSPRGPIAAGDPAGDVAHRALAVARWLRERGALVYAADPQLPADEDYERVLATGGFRPVEELQAERHRMVLDWPPGTTADALLADVAKSTRQRIRSASRTTQVAEAGDSASIDAFAALYRATARRRSFWVGDLDAAAEWWGRCLALRRGRLLVARHEGEIVGGLLLYRQGGRWATAYSADDATTRHALPGTMHLLRWTAIRDAAEGGDASIDLGGVDVPGARRIPRPGEPTYGLYEHKRSFGAAWLECAPAHEIVLRARLYTVDRGLALARSLVRRRRPPA